MGGKGCGDCMGVFNVELTVVNGKFVVMRISICRMMASKGSTIVEDEEGDLGGSPTGTKVWWSNSNGESFGVTGRFVDSRVTVC